MEDNHEEQLGDLSPANVYFNIRNNKTEGRCIICKRPTSFNEKTEKYERVHESKCKEQFRELFKKRMQKKYGKTTLLDDPEVQKKMLSKRKISGTYTWNEGKDKTEYVGSYEKDFLRFLDSSGFTAKNIFSPSPATIKYRFDGKDHFYIPDFFIPDLNLLVEIKGTNNHYQKREELREKAKDKAALNSKYNYIKIVNKRYDEFIKLVDDIKNERDSSGKIYY